MSKLHVCIASNIQKCQFLIGPNDILHDHFFPSCSPFVGPNIISGGPTNRYNYNKKIIINISAGSEFTRKPKTKKCKCQTNRKSFDLQ